MAGDTLDAVVMIGNSDDKLTQSAWARFGAETFRVSRLHALAVHGEWGSSTLTPWQNAGISITMLADHLDELRAALRAQADEYGQDSIALLVGNTEFVTP